jgi:hypothetical protein
LIIKHKFFGYNTQKEEKTGKGIFSFTDSDFRFKNQRRLGLWLPSKIGMKSLKKG